MIEIFLFQKKKYYLIFGGLVLALFLVSAKLCYLMLYSSEELSRKAKSVEQRERSIKAARGIIYYRNGIILADNQPVCSISVIYHQIKEPEKVIKLLSEKLDIPEKDIRKKVEKVSSREKIKSNVPKKTADEIGTDVVNPIFMKLFGRTTSMTDEEVRAALDPQKIAYAKTCIGGTAPAEVDRQLSKREAGLVRDEAELAEREAAVADAKRRLEAAVAEIIA